MTTNQPNSTESRLNRLETLFVNIGETVVGHDNTIDVLVANISQLTENVNRLSNSVDNLTINVQNLTDQATEDRQQAAIDRQQAAIDRQQATIDRQAWQAEIQRIWEYLLQQGGNGRQNQ